jgi:hypothetical protein
LYRAGVATLAFNTSSTVVTFSSALPAQSNVIVSLGVRDRAGNRLSNDDCFPAVAGATPSGFTLQWRDLSGSACTVLNGSVLVNWIAVAAQ